MTAISSPIAVNILGARILVVDDERRNRDLIEVMLTAEGYRVLTAASGADALAMVAEHLPDLVLLDVMMPGMDGYQVATRIKGDPATRHIPVMILSALDDRNSQMHGRSAGADGFLAKPVNRADLCERVQVLLRSARTATGEGAESGERAQP